MIQLEFSKQQITNELRMNPNERNVRILERMKQIFNLYNFHTLYSITSIKGERCTINCYSEGRGKTLKFIVQMNEELLPYFNLKLWLIQNCDFRSDFNYELVLTHLHLIQNNNNLTTLDTIAKELNTDVDMIKRHREKLNNKVFAPKDYCKQETYNANGDIIPFELYESINTSFKNSWNNIKRQYSNQAHVELYVKHNDNYEGDWSIISIANPDYSLIVDSLISKGYEFETSGLLYKDKKINKYLKDISYRYHLEINGINYIYIHTVYQLMERMKLDKEFNDLLNKTYNIYLQLQLFQLN